MLVLVSLNSSLAQSILINFVFVRSSQACKFKEEDIKRWEVG